jgi:chromate transporter
VVANINAIIWLRKLFVKYFFRFLYGIRPATMAIIVAAVFRLSKGLFEQKEIIVISLLVLTGALCGLNEVVLLFGAGIEGTLYFNKNRLMTVLPFPLLFVDNALTKLFFFFLR